MSPRLPILGPAYLARFECLADRCEDTCCAGLKVPVDAAGYARMRAALAGEGMAPERFEQLIPLNRDASDPEQHAFIEMVPHRGCPFLDERKLCSIHGRHGAATLANACATFPRSTTSFPDRLEVAGSFACPEVVRLALLGDEPLAPAPLPDSVLSREFVNRAIEDPAAAPYEAARDEVRSAVLRTLEDARHPLGSRLVFLGQLGHWVAPFYYRDCPAFDRAELSDRLRLLEDSAVLDPIHASFWALEPMTDKWIALALSILQQRSGGDAPARLQRVAAGALRAYGGPSAAALAERHGQLLSPARAQLERFFSRYAQSWWYRNPHTDSDDLTAHAFKLAFRLAMLNVMLGGHPDLAADLPPAGLDAIAVEVVQVFAKHLELSSELQDWTSGLAATSDSFANLVLLAKLA